MALMPGDDEVTLQRDILLLSAGLHSTAPSTPVSTPEDYKKPEAPANLINAIVALLTTATTVGAPEDERDLAGNRVVAATVVSNEVDRIEAFIITRNPKATSKKGTASNRDYRVELLGGDQCKLHKILFSPTPQRGYVRWEQHVKDVFSIFNSWSKSSMDCSTRELAFYIFFLRRCYPKIVARMRTAEHLWGDHPLVILHEWTSGHQPTTPERFELSIPNYDDGSKTEEVHGWLASRGLQPNESGKFIVGPSDTLWWTSLLKEEYEALKESLGSAQEGPEVHCLIRAFAALTRIRALASSKLFERLLLAVPSLTDRLHEPNDFKDETVKDFRVGNRLERCVKTLVSLIPSMVQVIQFLKLRLGTSFTASLIIYPPALIPLYKPAYLEEIINGLSGTVLSQDAKDYMLYGSKVAIYSDKNVKEANPAMEAQFQLARASGKVDRLSQLLGFVSKGMAHCEAIIMRAVYTSKVNDSGMKLIPNLNPTGEMPIGVGKWCCWLCWKLHLHLNSVIPSSPIVVSGSHGIVYTWVTPAGLPLTFLKALRTDLANALDTAAKKARNVVTSMQSSICGETGIYISGTNKQFKNIIQFYNED
ncbi:unnamed protein product [Cyclocybe aegerita]|uniref:Uncharacterized protein n=1 Tax=Cyclocybe aegerita TaxID=1973307 RepID=A0A8S0WYW4_CYCAE|nr:unnamed protein product [Cyclocybe aegerita]